LGGVDGNERLEGDGRLEGRLLESLDWNMEWNCGMDSEKG